MRRFVSKYIYVFKLVISVAILLFIAGCSNRESSPVTLDDSTISYSSTSKNGIYTTITFSNRISKKTGKPLNVGSTFKLKNKARLYATIILKNYESEKGKELLFHIDWLDSTSISFFKKRINFSPSDSVSKITSSISVSPQKRKMGKYYLRVYLFRELIAEKEFKLVKSITKSKTVIKETKKSSVQKSIKPTVNSEVIKAEIVLFRKLSKKTGKPVGAGTTFEIKDKANVKAIVNIEKPEIKTNEQMKFYFYWIGTDGKIYYKKRVIYTTSNPSFTISSSISISPEKRVPGTYTLQVILRKKVIAEQKFELISPI
jgi:hypothetical protein